MPSRSAALSLENVGLLDLRAAKRFGSAGTFVRASPRLLQRDERQSGDVDRRPVGTDVRERDGVGKRRTERHGSDAAAHLPDREVASPSSQGAAVTSNAIWRLAVWPEARPRLDRQHVTSRRRSPHRNARRCGRRRPSSPAGPRTSAGRSARRRPCPSRDLTVVDDVDGVERRFRLDRRSPQPPPRRQLFRNVRSETGGAFMNFCNSASRSP